MKKLWLVGLVLANILVLSGTASAKFVPFVEDPAQEWGEFDNPFQIANAGQFSGIYGRLGTYGDLDVFAYDFAEPQKEFLVEALVPVCAEHFRPFAPSVALIGPGLKSDPKAVFPFELPDDTGAVLVTTQASNQPENNAYFGAESQSHVLDRVEIPESGRYYIAVWESSGHIGAYVVSTGSYHPEFIDSQESARMAQAFKLVNSGQWMGQDCDTPLATEDCPPTPGLATAANDAPPAPERSNVGRGYVLSGDVRDAATCLPLAGAKITLWVRNEAGEYDDDHFATVYSNQQGLYRFESNFPGGPDPHIHIHISAPGYQAIVLEYTPEDRTTDFAVFPIALRPE